jgi:hypothetical protein
MGATAGGARKPRPSYFDPKSGFGGGSSRATPTYGFESAERRAWAAARAVIFNS